MRRSFALRQDDSVSGVSNVMLETGLLTCGRQYGSNHSPLVVHGKRGFRQLRRILDRQTPELAENPTCGKLA